ncbi:Hypothetical predicted protein [Olea europaea subsp. europaea]|uniref:VPS37 C-terminal domain-containing protein n=1 Tax=Olea europaea subsp. europaea TaxID=158383 RepID=A0A8S0TE75_OLEEU|nr:Hypothetical predicted protein [Olea europaea subsp. europaea]
MFKFWGSQEQQVQHHPQEVPRESWYSPSVVSSSSSHPKTPSAGSSSNFNTPRPADQENSSSNVSPAEAAGIIATLKDKSVDELRKLLSDKDAYQSLLLSLEPVKTQARVSCDCWIFCFILLACSRPLLSTINMYTCRIIRTTELATAQEKLHELERKKEDTLKNYSPASLLLKLQEAMNKTDEESEALHRQLLDREIDLTAFVHKYKKIRQTYHKHALTHLAMKTSVTS